MILISPDKYNIAEPALSDVEINKLFAESVIKHHVNGKVYVDNTTKPKCFYILHSSGMSLLYGEISNDFLVSSLKDYLLGKSSLRKTDESLQIFPINLEKNIDEVLGKNLCIDDTTQNQDFSSYDVIKYQRVNFRFNKEKFEQFALNLALKEYDFQLIDKALFDNITGSVVPNEFWKNANAFSSFGIGFSLFLENQPAAIAFSSSLHDNLLEIGVETKTRHRKQGLATIICVKLITYCLKNGYEPVWACRLGNHGSYNLALKLGFEPIAYLPYYELLSI